LRPYLDVQVLEVSGLKHSGGHATEIDLLGELRRSVFIDGGGAWKPIAYSTRFGLHSGNFADHAIRVKVFHERFITEPKQVGECSIPLDLLSSGEVLGWFPLQYKCMPRGAVKVLIKAVNITSPAASATVPLDPSTRRRLLSQRAGSPDVVVSKGWPK